MKEIKKITVELFYKIRDFLVKSGMDSDNSSFIEIRKRLDKVIFFTPTEFAKEVSYVICVSGFKQVTGKKIYEKIIDYIDKEQNLKFEDLIKIFRNENKIKASIKMWKNKQQIQKDFYNLKTTEEKLDFLSKLQYIGNITKYHIARNLGINFVKYDIWIQRLGVALYGNMNDIEKIDNRKLNNDVKFLCDKMFDDLKIETNEKIGYIDVVLWKACQQGILKINNNVVYLTC
jgi:hypothetical protein